jgi:hypothetical protein
MRTKHECVMSMKFIPHYQALGMVKETWLSNYALSFDHQDIFNLKSISNSRDLSHFCIHALYSHCCRSGSPVPTLGQRRRAVDRAGRFSAW